MVVPDVASMVANLPQFPGQYVVVREDRAAITIAAQILARKETRTGDMSDRTRLPPGTVLARINRTDGLCIVLDHE